MELCQSYVLASPKQVNLWAHDGWVDLRVENMERWKARFAEIVERSEEVPLADTSSRYMYTREYWKNYDSIDPGKLAGWIFSYEEQGMRMKD